MSKQINTEQGLSYSKKVWIAGLIFALITVILLIFEATFNIVMLVLAGALIACYFRGISGYLKRKFHLNGKLSMAISVFGSFLILGGMMYLVGATIWSQTVSLKESLPELTESLKDFLEQSDIGRDVLAWANEITSSKEFSNFVSTFFITTFGSIANIYIIILTGIFFTIAPNLYVNGITELVPPPHRKRAKEVLDNLGTSLTKWLAGKFIAMFAVFVLTAIGLLLFDVKHWLTLSILAGLLNFIPNFGPLISAVPALLVGLSQDLNLAIIIGVMYLAIQLFESSFITPKAQYHLIRIPPALIILAQIFVGALTGLLGVIFATPLMLIVIILVQELYITPMNRKYEVSKSHN
ncbi:AI-2E family transporter [Gelidibacter pelagius]|uniref:AI-2E family transporter n=1 Tax=Gelidibacter pelagius TaxID=2819985 RepID=A0ABS3SSI8_9FLAO|nr:AI-2E family transporter [Gelidibacter pelagius]MBO3098658.1 AI-2E family transporter [Gelidibacter pelagius]